MNPRYPVFVPTRGRADVNQRLTLRTLIADDVPFRAVVEPQEADAYARVVGRDRLLILPFRDQGTSTPARNFIRDVAEQEGHARHWQLDDNISNFYRYWEGWRIPCHAGTALRICEDFADRFENVGVAGLNYDMFVTRTATQAAFVANVHVYSCMLIDHAMPYRWRLRYNDDTDLCLQALTGGWATVLLNAVLAKKETTMRLSGGNTESLYRGDGETRDTRGRFVMTETLRATWPGLVRTSRRFGRYHHSVNWGRFVDQPPLRLRDDFALAALPEHDEHGLTLRPVRDVRSDQVRRVAETYADVLPTIPLQDARWRGLPAFRPVDPPTKLVLNFASEEDRDRLTEQLGVTIDKRFRDKAWSAQWPPRGRHDPASLRFQPEAI